MLLSEKRAPVRGGFTLMEMLVVVAILVVLAGAAVPIYMNYLENARLDRAWTDAKTIASTAEAYKLSNGGNPPESLVQLTVPNQATGLPYLESSSLKDPWGRDYLYAPVGTHNTTGKVEVWSLGPRGNTEIGSWMTGAPR